jgi:sugar lactone lactonase YvrE
MLAGWLAACAVVAPRQKAESEAPARAWPPENPRVRLERVIELGPRRESRWFGRRQGVEGAERPFAATWLGEDLVVTDPDARRLLRVHASGRVDFSSSMPDTSLVGITACLGGLVVSDSRQGTVTRWDESLVPRQRLAANLLRPSGLACAGDTVFVAETGRHRIVALREGAAARAFGGRGETRGQFNFPTFLALSRNGLWIADTLNFRLQRLDPATGFWAGGFGQLGDALGDLPRTKGVAVDPLGRLWVSDGLLDRVLVFQESGDLLLVIGGPGQAPGEFAFPAGIAMNPDGRVAIVDSLNRRLQIFRSLAEAGT